MNRRCEQLFTDPSLRPCLPPSLFFLLLRRYWGFAAADIFIPGPTYSSVTATEMENFYGEGWDRKYKVLGARSREVAKVRIGSSLPPSLPSSPFFPLFVYCVHRQGH